jgi:hypothetical protein
MPAPRAVVVHRASELTDAGAPPVGGEPCRDVGQRGAGALVALLDGGQTLPSSVEEEGHLTRASSSNPTTSSSSWVRTASSPTPRSTSARSP